MFRSFTIRRKVALTFAIPIVVLGTICSIGYQRASDEVARHEDTYALVQTMHRIHAIARDIGTERMLYQIAELDGRADPENDRALIAAQTELTDVSLEALAADVDDQPRVGSIRSALDKSAAALTAARSTPVGRSSNFATAIGHLLDAADQLTLEPMSGGSQQGIAAVRSIHRSIEATDQAWIAFAERPTEEIRPTAEIIERFAVAERLEDDLLLTAGAGTRDRLDEAVSASATADELRFSIREDLLNSSEGGVAPRIAVLTRADVRGAWLGAATAVDESVSADLAAQIVSADATRINYGLFGMFGALVFGALGMVLAASIASPIITATDNATEWVRDRLPSFLRSLQNSDDMAPVPAAIDAGDDDEIGRLVGAMNAVQTTLMVIAREQSVARDKLAARSAALARKNAALIYELVRTVADWRATEPDHDTRGRLFLIDHVATRMQRTLEAILLLSGAHSARHWNNPISVTNTVRLALGEVVGYERVDLTPMGEVRLPGSAAPDVAHILAELIDNALGASDPHAGGPHTQVTVRGDWVPAGFAFTVHDDAAGIDAERRDELNRRLRTVQPLHEGPTDSLGLVIVAALARRHGIDVRLLEGATTGTVARVVLPVDLIDPATVPVDRQAIAAGRGSGDGKAGTEIGLAPTERQRDAARVFFGTEETSPLVTTEDINAELRKLVDGDIPEPAPRGERPTTAPSTLRS